MKIKNFFTAFCVLCALIFAGCASVRGGEVKFSKVYVTNTAAVDILPVGAVSSPVDEYLYFEGTFGESAFSSLAYLSADSTGISVVLLSELGMTLGSLLYDGVECVLDCEFIPKRLKAEYIVLDVQNAYADAAALKDHYAKYGLTFDSVSDGEAETRTLKKGSKVIEEIEIYGGRVTIKNFVRNYTYVFAGSM